MSVAAPKKAAKSIKTKIPEVSQGVKLGVAKSVATSKSFVIRNKYPVLGTVLVVVGIIGFALTKNRAGNDSVTATM